MTAPVGMSLLCGEMSLLCGEMLDSQHVIGGRDVRKQSNYNGAYDNQMELLTAKGSTARQP